MRTDPKKAERNKNTVRRNPLDIDNPLGSVEHYFEIALDMNHPKPTAPPEFAGQLGMYVSLIFYDEWVDCPCEELPNGDIGPPDCTTVASFSFIEWTTVLASQPNRRILDKFKISPEKVGCFKYAQGNARFIPVDHPNYKKIQNRLLDDYQTNVKNGRLGGTLEGNCASIQPGRFFGGIYDDDNDGEEDDRPPGAPRLWEDLINVDPSYSPPGNQQATITLWWDFCTEDSEDDSEGGGQVSAL